MAEKKAEAAPAQGGKKKLLLFIAIGTVLVLVSGVIAYLLLGKEEETPRPNLANEVSQVGAAKGEGPATIGPMIEIESFVVNIIDDKDSRYLKAAITLEMDSPEAVVEVKERMPQVRDAILLLVGNKTYNEVRDLQGKLQLRVELMQKISDIVRGGKVRRIYFTDFVVQ
jgi:flagellar FliL protein